MEEFVAIIAGVLLWSLLLYGGYRLFRSFMRGFVAGLETPVPPVASAAQVCSWCGAALAGVAICTVCGKPKKE